MRIPPNGDTNMNGPSKNLVRTPMCQLGQPEGMWYRPPYQGTLAVDLVDRRVAPIDFGISDHGVRPFTEAGGSAVAPGMLNRLLDSTLYFEERGRALTPPPT